ncbi:MAG: PolC-type DNA polymerase III [Bacillota bacterium]
MKLFWSGRLASKYNGPPPAAEVVETLKTLLDQCQARPDSGTPLTDVCFLVIDTETTGLSPAEGDEIIAVGAVAVEHGCVQRQKVFNRLVNPYRDIPLIVTELTGITADMVDSAGDIFTVLQDFLPLLRNTVVVGHYVDFDLEFLNRRLQQVCNGRIGNPVLDTCTISRALYPRWASHSLDHLLANHQIEPTGRHTALGDALLTAELFVQLLELLRGRGVYTLGDLHLFLDEHLDYYYRVGFNL